MLPNVVGMSQHADGGLTATKPYAGGGAYLNRMSDYCSSCRFAPTRRVGASACPYGGLLVVLTRNAERLAGNYRMTRPMRGLDRLPDLDAVVEQESARGSAAHS